MLVVGHSIGRSNHSQLVCPGVSECNWTMEHIGWICPICFEVTASDMVVQLSHCGCSFCRSCLTRYLTTMLSDSLNTDFTCPSYQCEVNGMLTNAEIKDLIPNATLYEQYLNRCREKEVHTNNALTFCPAPGCGAICDIKPQPHPHLQSTHSSGCVFKRFRFWNPPSAAQKQSAELACLTTKNLPVSKTIEHDVPDVFLGDGNDNDPFPTNHERLPNATPSNILSSHSPSRKSQAIRVTCPRCGHVFCARCHLEWDKNDHCQCETLPHQERSCFPFRKLTRYRSVYSESASEKDTLSLQHDTPNRTVSPSLTKKANRSRRVRLRIPAYRNSHKAYSRVNAKLDTNRDFPPNQVGVDLAVGFPPYPQDASLKRCPTCFVPIERVDGCAQMRCRSCKHTFCWYCLSSLDRDVLLRHFDVGACKGKLGHSRASILGHRIYVISVFTGFTLLFILTAPFVLISLPCILCSKCELAYRQRRLRKRHTAGVVLPSQDNSLGSDNQLSEPPNSPSNTRSAEHNPAQLVDDRSSLQVFIPQTADIHWCVETTPDGSTDVDPTEPGPPHCATLPS